jgi:hypothetical protein
MKIQNELGNNTTLQLFRALIIHTRAFLRCQSPKDGNMNQHTKALITKHEGSTPQISNWTQLHPPVIIITFLRTIFFLVSEVVLLQAVTSMLY